MNSEIYNISNANLSEFSDKQDFYKFCFDNKVINDIFTAWQYMKLTGSVRIWQKKSDTIEDGNFAVSEKRGEINILRLEFVSQERAFQELEKSAEYSLWIWNGLNWKEIE